MPEEKISAVKKERQKHLRKKTHVPSEFKKCFKLRNPREEPDGGRRRGTKNKRKLLPKVEYFVLIKHSVHSIVNIFIRLNLHLFKFVQKNTTPSSVITYLSKGLRTEAEDCESRRFP